MPIIIKFNLFYFYLSVCAFLVFTVSTFLQMCQCQSCKPWYESILQLFSLKHFIYQFNMIIPLFHSVPLHLLPYCGVFSALTLEH
jgi:hypothetical protein